MRVKCATLAWHTLKAALEGGARPRRSSAMREARTLSRDVEVAAIPYGDRITLTAGTTVYITQSLGGSFTVMTDKGYMVRIEGKDADAIGETPVLPPTAEEAAGALHARPRLGPAQDLLRPRDPGQHRGPGPRLRVRGRARRGRRATVTVALHPHRARLRHGRLPEPDVQQKLMACRG